MNIKKPEFFVVGAPKCGTTSLCNYLRDHPDVFVPNRKELHYFGSDLKYHYRVDSLGKYLEHFKAATTTQLPGEGSVWYLYSTYAAREIYSFNPDARIIIMIRDPIDMIQSLHAQWVLNGYTDIYDFEAAIRAQDNKFTRGFTPNSLFRDRLVFKDAAKYTAQIQRYVDVFGRDRTHIILYDDFEKDTRGEYSNVLRFLNLEPKVPKEFPRFNRRQTVKYRAFRDFVKHPPPSAVPFIKGAIPVGRARRFLRRAANHLDMKFTAWYFDRQSVNPEFLNELREEYRDEVRKLEKLLDRDLSTWSGKDVP